MTSAISRTLRHTAVAGALLALLACAGCGPGRDTEQSSNRGSGSDTTETTVENAYIVPRFVPGSCAVQIGDTADLRFTVTNNRATEAEQLLGVTTPAAESVRIEPAPPLEIPAGMSIAAGQPVAPGEPFTVTLVGVNDTLRPALSTDVMFQFENFGELAIGVSVEACPTQQE